jgi:hypothetical protein
LRVLGGYGTFAGGFPDAPVKQKNANRNDGPSSRILRLSAESVERLLANALRHWSILFGRTRLAKQLGITHSRLGRIVGSSEAPRLSFDLTFRIHVGLGISWPGIFVPSYLEGDTLHVVRRALAREKAPVSRADVRKAEERLRTRLEEMVRERGLRGFSRLCGIPQATLHSYTVSAGIPLGALWRIHLATGTPYTWLVSGRTSPEEQAIAERVGRSDDPTGRFPDAYEPVVKMAGRLISMSRREGTAPWISVLRDLGSRRLSAPQEVRILRLLAGWHFRARRRDRGEAIFLRAWKRLESEGVASHPGTCLAHLEFADFYGLWELFEKIFASLESERNPPAVKAVLQIRRAGNRLGRLDVFGAVRSARRGEHQARFLPPPEREVVQANARYFQAVAAWAFGDAEEALGKIRQIERSPHLGIGGLSMLADLEFHIRIWRKEVGEAGRAWKRLSGFSPAFFESDAFQRKMDICRLRSLLLRREVSGALSTLETGELRDIDGRLRAVRTDRMGCEARCTLAVCRFLLHGDSGPIRRIARLLASGRGFPLGFPFFTLPDFMDAFRSAGISARGFEKWKSAAVEKGLLSLDLHGPRF